jgi:hypothetical protein
MTAVATELNMGFPRRVRNRLNIPMLHRPAHSSNIEERAMWPGECWTSISVYYARRFVPEKPEICSWVHKVQNAYGGGFSVHPSVYLSECFTPKLVNAFRRNWYGWNILINDQITVACTENIFRQSIYKLHNKYREYTLICRFLHQTNLIALRGDELVRANIILYVKIFEQVKVLRLLGCSTSYEKERSC